MWLWNIISVLAVIFCIYVVFYSICIRRLERRNNHISYQDRGVKRDVYKLTSYLRDTLDVLILQGASYDTPEMSDLREIYLLIESPYTMSLKEIEDSIDKVARILKQENIHSGLKEKITHELSEVSISCDQIKLYERSTTLYDYQIHRIFFPLKRLFRFPNRQI